VKIMLYIKLVSEKYIEDFQEGKFNTYRYGILTY